MPRARGEHSLAGLRHPLLGNAQSDLRVPHDKLFLLARNVTANGVCSILRKSPETVFAMVGCKQSMIGGAEGGRPGGHGVFAQTLEQANSGSESYSPCASFRIVS